MPRRSRNRPAEPPPEVWYRAERFFTENRIAGGHNATIYFDTFAVIRRTPQGVWLDGGGLRKPKWVSTSTRKRFAYPTKAQAFTNLVHRARHYMHHCNRRLAQANAAVQATHDYELTEE